MKTGRPLPDAIQNAPELWPGLESYYNAWVALDSCRGIGFGVGPIPWTSIEEYATRLEYDEDERETLHRMVRMLDGVYLDHNRKKP